MDNKSILIYFGFLFGVLASVYTGNLWVAGILVFIGGNFKIIQGITSSEGGQKKFNIFLLIGFNLSFLNMLF